MGLVAATCFQHNPATQPQAFTVLGHLASDEVDDDLVYQILVAMGSTLQQFSENENLLVNSMLRCLARITSGLSSDSRYPLSLFWLGVGVLQLGYIPVFANALGLMLAALRAIPASDEPLSQLLLQGRAGAEEAARKLDQVSGISFATDVSFSLVAIVFKGVRHPSTRKLSIDVMLELLRHSAPKSSVPVASVTGHGLAFFAALLPVFCGSPDELKALWKAAALAVPDAVDLSSLSMLSLISLP